MLIPPINDLGQLLVFWRAQIEASTAQALQNINGTASDALDHEFAIAQRVLTGVAPSSDNDAMQPDADSCGIALLTHSQNLVDAGRARGRRSTAVASLRRSARSAMLSFKTIDAMNAEMSAVAHSIIEQSTSAMLTPRAWVPFMSDGTGGSSVMAATPAGFQIVHQASAGINGMLIRLADLGISPTLGTAVSLVASLASVPALPAGSIMSIGLCNSAAAKHALGTDMVPMLDIGSMAAGVPASAMQALSGARDAVYIGGIAPSAAAITIALKSLSVIRAQ